VSLAHSLDMGERMPRELTDISDEVRSVPPPPIPVMPEPYAVRVADPDADAEMISAWMYRPELVRAWRYLGPPSQWHHHLSAQLAGTYSRPVIVSFEGEDFLYAEMYRAAKDIIATVYKADPYDVGAHGAIASRTFMKKGHAQLLAPSTLGSLFDQESQCRRFMADTHPTNMLARRFCEKAGFGFLGEHDLPNRRRTALYVLPRSPADTPRLGEAP
jgi:lysine N-acyltransferase